MAEKTKISWTDHTFNIAWGCVKVSPGCRRCYAERDSKRYGHKVWGPNAPRRTFSEKHWNEPRRWNKAAAVAGVRAKVFGCSMCDWGEDHPIITAELAKFWPLIRETPWIDWQLLTKRSERIADCLPSDWGDGYENVWLGVSVENDDYVSRVDDLRKIPARVRFISYEPALGPAPSLDLSGIHWLIYGGESGPRFQQDEDAWAREALAKCRASGTAFFYKQSASLWPGHRPTLDGVEYHEFPVVGAGAA